MIIPVSMADWRYSDPGNVIGVIVDKKIKFKTNRIGTEHELLIGSFGSCNLKIATSNVIIVDRIKQNKKKIFT